MTHPHAPMPWNRLKGMTFSRLVAEATSSGTFLLAVLGAIAIGLGLFSLLWRQPFVLIYLLFYVGFDVADRLVRPAFDVAADHDTTPACRLNMMLMLALFAAAPFERHYIRSGQPPMLLSALGVLVQLSGLLLALGARMQLGRFGTPHLAVFQDHEIVRNGLYRHIRHPIYTGGIISRQAWAIVFGAPIVLILGAAADVLLMSWRIKSEETMMLERFGDRYRSYMAETYRLFPGVC